MDERYDLEEGADLYRRYLQGDGAALEALVALYGDALVRFAYCYLRDEFAAEDAAEDAFAALIVKRRALPDETDLRAYLYKAVRNNCLDRIRAEKRRSPLEGAEGKIASEPALFLEREERKALLYRCLEELPPQYKGVLYLVYLEGFRPEEAAKILKRTKKQTYNLLARAKAALRGIFVKKGVRYEDL